MCVVSGERCIRIWLAGEAWLWRSCTPQQPASKGLCSHRISGHTLSKKPVQHPPVLCWCSANDIPKPTKGKW